MRFVSRTTLMLFGGILLVLMQNLLTPVASAHSLTFNVKHTHLATSSSCLQPPHNENLMALSDSALMAFGLPSHKTISQNPAHWSSVFSHLGPRVCEQGHALSLPPNIAKHDSIIPHALGDGCNIRNILGYRSCCAFLP